jgi:hypothetical protein
VVGANAVAGPANAQLREAAGVAFSAGLSAVMLTCAAIAVLGALLCLWFLPRDGAGAPPVEVAAPDAVAAR